MIQSRKMGWAMLSVCAVIALVSVMSCRPIIDSNENEDTIPENSSGVDDSGKTGEQKDSAAAKLVLSEVKNYGTTTHGEYVEVYVVSGGSTEGLKLVTGSGKADYEFPTMIVKTGEYIVVHYRKGKESDKNIDETGTNLNLATGFDTSAARDLWVNPESGAKISSKNDVIALYGKDDTMLDAVLYATPSEKTGEFAEKYTLKSCQDLAKSAKERGLWASDAPAEALSAVKSNVHTRTFGRQNIETLNSGVGSKVWLLTNKQTPGAKNSNTPYVPSDKE